MAAAIPGARLELIEGGGHLVRRPGPGPRQPPDPRLRPPPGGDAMTADAPTATPTAYGRDSGRARLPDRTGFAAAVGRRAARLGRLRQRASRRSCSSPRRRSSTRASGRPRSPTSAGTSASSPTTAAATAARIARRPRGLRRRPSRRGHRGRAGRRRTRTGRARGPVRRRRLAGDPARGDASRSASLGIVAFAIGVPLALRRRIRGGSQYSFDDELPTDEGWAKLNRHYWRRDYPGFARFFFGEIASEPHSTKVDRGRGRLGGSTGRSRRCSPTWTPPFDTRPRGRRGDVPRGALPDAPRPRHGGPLPAARRARSAGRAHRRAARRGRGRRPHDPGPPPGARQPADPRLRPDSLEEARR